MLRKIQNRLEISRLFWMATSLHFPLDTVLLFKSIYSLKCLDILGKFFDAMHLVIFGEKNLLYIQRTRTK